MEMDTARYDPMDAQRFDPLLRTSARPNSLFKTGTEKSTMGQGLCVRTRPCMLFPVRASVGGVWPDHEVVVVPLEGGDADSEASRSSTPSSSSTSTTYTTASSAMPDVPPSHTQQVDAYERDDVVVTRTIIRPNPTPNLHPNPSRMPSRAQMILPRMFSRSPSPTASPSSSLSALPRSNPPSRPTSPVLQALNCFNTSSTFERDEDNVHIAESPRPVLQVIVTQTRDRYEDDRAFKEIVGSVYPGPVAAAASVGSGA
ncbi:hypothetical protein DFJ58DRAFT_858713 [Suillus subalutaceus]|uniref:uncharacterized protein n=1 Tax=Suillus subalutaceus TaxID=48586 RepID=UPI001B864BA5|nr:uncharacterized protein DFJ58DRAFT_858713 [Suillus subalutaceus]KAG1868259.1 hypothetical protein DFJ58DRAFT_858713 [Suillus subalutaceus]